EVDSADASDGEAPFDGGPPIWVIGALDAGVVTAPTGNTSCTFEVLSVQTAFGPPQYDLYLSKRDFSVGSCNEPKGARRLNGTYAAPAARLLKSAISERYVVAYNVKASASGSSALELVMAQFDPVSGNDMHVALMKTKTVMGMPATPTLPISTLF